MTDARAFRGFRFPAEVILWAVRWYLQFPISYRDLERMLADRGVEVDHTTMYRWVQRFAPELEKRTRRHLRPCRGPWHVDETYLRAWRWLFARQRQQGTVSGLAGRRCLRGRRDARDRRLADAEDAGKMARALAPSTLRCHPGALPEGELILRTELDAARACPGSPFRCPCDDQLALELGQATEHRQHEPPVRRRGVGPGVAKRTEGGAPFSDSSKNVQQIAR